MQTRRQFIKDSSALAGGASLGLALNSRLLAQTANDRVVFGLIGCGTMGRENMRHFLQLKQPVAAVCDVDETHLERAALK